ncbi:GNAT family N-acetyltransferase [Rubrivirga sp. IMCC43871]|uniref:GNAT family N-acetyltransferase n=1 Tax=Rubrivirga sp. IMCC43871 TaxID=3391575 RepID=UPI003990096E
MTVRPLRPDDLGAAHALWASGAPLDPLAPDALADLLWGDGANALAAESDGRLVGLGAGALWPVADEVRGSVRAVLVARDARRQGVGTALLAGVETDLRQRGAAEARLVEGAPVYLTPGVDARATDALAFVDSRGYVPFAESVDLAADLDQPLGTADDETRLAAAGVAVHRASEADRAGLTALLDAHWPAWQAEADRALAQDPPPLHVAVRDARVLGFAAHSVTPLARGRFGPMGTAPEARGLGIGAVLLRRCLRDLRDDGRPQVVIGWAAALPFYESAVGASVARRYRRLAKALG